MRTCVFLDLDDTILQTRPKCPPGEPLSPAADDRNGRPLSFMTERQRALLSLLSAAGTVIPTTARNLDAYRRVRLAFTDLAVLDFGGVILRPDGTPEPDWDASIRPRALEMGPELHTELHAVQQFIDARRLEINARLIADFDMPLYLVLKHPAGNVAALQTVLREHWGGIDPQRFFIHCNGNNLSLVPRFLGKERAVQHIRAHLLGTEPVLTIGVGDSVSDAPFLAACDYALLPRDCQLAAHPLSPRG
ncbi:MAG: hypothetical protein K2R98_20130 [Gemmataceae bacterium]|nr:hypothetical protein [Gemmataceae bacterium]